MHMVTRNVLSSRAMLCGLRITNWTARKLDKRVTAEVNAEHGASADAGRYNKALLAKDSLAPIVTAANAARSLHYARTLPWLDDGARLLPAAAYADFAPRMGRLRDEFNAAVDAFVAGYPAYVDAARVRLNGMWRAEDYPAVSEIRSRFSFSVRVLPVPDAGDFRVDVGDAAAAEIRAAVERDTRAALETAMRDAWARVAETVGRMAERLAAYKPGADGSRAEGIFRDSLVENVRDLAAILPGLNLTNDPALSAVADRMARELCQHGADDLRESDVLRKATAESAESILADVSAFMA